MKKILVINAGSSSIKYQLLDFDTLNPIVWGICERIFVDGNFIANTKDKKFEIKTEMKNHEQALDFMVNYFLKTGNIKDNKEITVIGHRIVHGGISIKKSEIINDEILKIIENCIELAPLHNKPEFEVILAAQKIFSSAINVGVFDTSFHQDIPTKNHLYALPYDWYEDLKIRRYGFHGTSYAYINQEAEKILNKKKLNIIVCHLGSGASICAIKNGKSYNTSMGFTPLEGLVMGTRSGNVDFGILEFVKKQLNLKSEDVINVLNKKSGMLGLTGFSDFRDIFKNISNKKVLEAYSLYIQRLTNYIVSYINDLENKVDAIIFTAGVGENVPQVRRDVLKNIYTNKILIDEKLNESKYEQYNLISNKESEFPVYVIRTNEEKMIAMDCKKLLK